MFNKDLYYKKYLKYKKKYIDLQSQLGGAPMSEFNVSNANVSDDPVSDSSVSRINPIIIRSPPDEPIVPKVKNIKQRAFKPPSNIQLNNPTNTRKGKKSSDKVPRLLPYVS